MSEGRVTIFLSLRRDITARQWVSWELRKSWWVGPSRANPHGVTRSKVIAEGRFEHPDAVDDVDVLIAELAEHLKPNPHAKPAHGDSVPAVEHVRGQSPLPLPL